MEKRVCVVGKERGEVVPLLREAGFSVVERDPELVASYGGDGTLMRAEALFPGVPKVVLKGSAICKRCSPLPNGKVLGLVRDGKYRIEELMKLEARAKGKALLGVNDVIVHNGDPRHAIRYRVTVDGRPVGGEIVGDGIVVATPFGSTAYYRSITDSFFEVGIGLAFNNSTEQSDRMVLGENSVVTLEVVRGPAAVYADNGEEMIELYEGDCVTVGKSREVARLVRVEE